MAESGLREEEEARRPRARRPCSVMTMHAAKGLEFDHVFVPGCPPRACPGAHRARRDEVPAELLKESLPDTDPHAAHEAEMRRLLHVAMTRARTEPGAGLAGEGRPAPPARPSPFYEEARAAGATRRR